MVVGRDTTVLVAQLLYQEKPSLPAFERETNKSLRLVIHSGLRNSLKQQAVYNCELHKSSSLADDREDSKDGL